MMRSIRAAAVAALLLMAVVVGITAAPSAAAPVIGEPASSVDVPDGLRLETYNGSVFVMWNSGNYDKVNVYRENTYVDTVDAPRNYFIDAAGQSGDGYYLVGVRDGQFSTRSGTEYVGGAPVAPVPVMRSAVKEAGSVLVTWNSDDNVYYFVYRNRAYIGYSSGSSTSYSDASGQVGDSYSVIGWRDGAYSDLSLPVRAVAGQPEATPKVLVIGDSISAGYKRPSYRQPMLDILTQADCAVDMVGDQTLNGYDFRPTKDEPGYVYYGFDRASGYDVDHQAFPAISAQQYVGGAYEASSAATYVARTDPDFILIHLGSNDLAGRVNNDKTSDDTAEPVLDSIFQIVREAKAEHPRPDDVKVLVANVIPYMTDEILEAQAIAEADERDDPEFMVANKLSEDLRRLIENKIASDNDSQVSLVDVASGFDTETMTFDGLHPNGRGEEHMARAFVRALDDAGLCPDASLPTRFPALPENLPVMMEPVPGDVLGDQDNPSVQTFQWKYLPANATQWYLRIGRTEGGDEYFDSGRIYNGSARQFRVPNLPTNGETVWVEFSVKLNTGAWKTQNFSVTAAG